jgi:hypothetical protein
MAMSRDQRRALRLLAAAPNGATEATMLAHGFTIEMLDALCGHRWRTVPRQDRGAGRGRRAETVQQF